MRYGLLLVWLISVSAYAQTGKTLPLLKAGSSEIRKQPIRTMGTGKRIALPSSVTITGQFSLSASARTSAGVYSSSGALVRTLWSNVSYPAGSIRPKWDGNDDFGVPVNAGNYYIKLLSSNVQYAWLGTLGNTSFNLANQTGMQRGYRRTRTMWVEGNKAFFGNGYAEGHPSQAYFATSAPQTRIEFLRDSKTGQATVQTTSDGVNVYWAGYDLFSANKRLNFIFATKVSDNALVNFSNGVPISTAQGEAYGETYASSIDTVAGVLPANTSVYTGMAVQRSGNYLFVSHGVQNQIRVLNKTTGALVRTITRASPGGLAIDRASDNALWVIAGAGVTRRTINSDGTLSAATLTLPNLSKPMALACSHDGTTVAVCDGDTSQRVKGYSASGGALLWSLGTKGGYRADPNVNTNKFYFDDVSLGINDTFISFAADGSFWVGDNGNYRSLHYSGNRAYIDQIAYLENCYTTAVDQNNPTRLFAQYLEFAVSDYENPATSWTLVRNYRATVPADYFENEYNRLQNIFLTDVFVDLATVGGHTYALLKRFSDKKWAVVELLPNAPLRFTPTLLNAGPYAMAADGGLLLQEINAARTVSTWRKQALLSIDGSGNPQYGSATVLQTAPLTPNDPYDFTGYGSPFNLTSTGQLITFHAGLYDAATGAGLGYHLGAVVNNQWAWRSHMATSRTYQGPYPKDGAYDIGNGVNYGGGNAPVVGRSVYPTYHGENWKNGQVNKFAHFYDNGLLVGDFGVTQAESMADPVTYRGMAGNVFGATGVQASNGNHYLVHGEEFGWSGLHVWRISNLSSIAEQTITAIVSSEADPRGMPLFVGLPRSVSLVNGVNGVSRNFVESGENTMRTGYVTYGRNQQTDLVIGADNSTAIGVKEGFYRFGSLSGVASWTLTFQLEYTAYGNNNGSYNEANSNGAYPEIRDANGRVLIRYDQRNVGDSVELRANGILIASGPSGNSPVRSFAPVVITVNANVITFKYGTYNAVTIVKLDPSSDLTSPQFIGGVHVNNNTGSNTGRFFIYKDAYIKTN